MHAFFTFSTETLQARSNLHVLKQIFLHCYSNE